MTNSTIEDNFESHNEIRYRNAKLLIVDVTICVLCGLSLAFALLGLVAKNAWITERFRLTRTWQQTVRYASEFQNARILVWLGTTSGGIAFVIGLLRIRVQPISNSRQCRTAQFFNLIISFISLLSSVAIWADFLRHMDPLYPQPTVGDLVGSHRSQADIGKSDSDRPTRLPDSSNSAVFANHKHDRVHLALGWAYWCCVGAVLCLFLCNLIYLMRKDCEPNRIDLVDNGNAL